MTQQSEQLWGVSERATAVHAAATVCEIVLPIHWELGNSFETAERFTASGYNYVSFTIAGDDYGIGGATERLADARAKVLGQPDKYILVESVADIHRAKAEGKTAIGFHFEGNRCLERNLNMIETYYKLGVRYNNIAFNRQNDLGSGCIEKNDTGLSIFGREVVREMRRIGMLLDLSHTGVKTSLDAMECFEGPAMFSHSMPRALNDHFRNLTDEQIKRCAESGGLIGMSGSSGYIGVEKATPESLLPHIDYIAELVGPEHIGLGLDLVVDPDMLMQYMHERPDEWFQDGKVWPPVNFIQPEQVPAITETLLQHGYSETDVKGILGGNFLRVAAEVWK